MDELPACDQLKVLINGHFSFFLHQSILCSYSERLRSLQYRHDNTNNNRLLIRNNAAVLRITDFPGGAPAFELAARFCYNNGCIPMSPATVPLLYCAAIFLEMTESAAPCNLLAQIEAVMSGLFYWTWVEVLAAMKACEAVADAPGCDLLLDKLVAVLFAKISATSEMPPLSSSSGSSSPDTAILCRSSSTTAAKTPDQSMKMSLAREWWFDDLTVLSPAVVEKMMKSLGCYSAGNKNLILTRFLLHYLRSKAASGAQDRLTAAEQYGGLADTAVHGVVLVGRAGFSCRGLFWVLRTVSHLGLSRECRHKLEGLIGMMLDQATLDDLLVAGSSGGHEQQQLQQQQQGSSCGSCVYDVSVVLRLVRVFVESVEEEEEDDGGGDEVVAGRMKRAGKLVDKYLAEISPDPGLRVSKFLAVAQSLPDAARDCFDGVYRALDIYLESHPGLSTDDRMSLCRCLNYEKLSLEACKDLAKNRRIPPGIAVQALASQQSKLQIKNDHSFTTGIHRPDPAETPRRRRSADVRSTVSMEARDEKEMLRLNLQRMQSKVMELEKTCKEMKGQMSKMAKSKSGSSSGSCYYGSNRGYPRLC